jgi:hypothetical protein
MGTGVGGSVGVVVAVVVVVVDHEEVIELLEARRGDLVARTEWPPDEPASTNPHAPATATKARTARLLSIHRSRRAAARRRIRRAMSHAHSYRGAAARMLHGQMHRNHPELGVYPVKRGTTGICTVEAAIASTVRGSVST